MPEQVVASEAGSQIIIGRTTEGSQPLLVANRGGPRQALVVDRSLATRPMAPIAG